MQKYLWLVMAGLLVAVVAAVFCPAAGFDFVNYDDTTYLINNPYLRYGLTAQGVRWAFSMPIFARAAEYSPFWRPLTYLTHMLDMQLYDLKAGGHHLTSILLHALNTVLLFLVFLKMTRRLWPCAFLAALFAVHPLQVEPVVWISARTSLLSTFWGLLTIASYLNWVGKKSAYRYVPILVCYAFCLMSKSSLVSLPFLLLLLDYWPLERALWGKAELPNWRARIAEKWPLFAMALAGGLVTLWTQPLIVHYFPSWERWFLTVLASYGFYLGKAVWPLTLTLYPNWAAAHLSAGYMIGCALALVVLSEFSFWSAKKSPYLLMGWVWYLAAIFPVAALPQPADRYMYEPGIGLAIMLAWGLSDFLPKWRPRRILLPAVAGILVAALMTVSSLQARYWENGITLYGHVLKIYPDHYVAHANLGNALGSRGRLDEAIAHFKKAIEISPLLVPPYENLGTALILQGRMEEAGGVYGRILGLEPNNWKAYAMLGWIAKMQGDYPKAIADEKKAVELKPDEWEPHMNLGFFLEESGHRQEAADAYRRSLALNDNNPEVHFRLGSLLARDGDRAGARAHYDKAEKFSPGFLKGRQDAPRAQD